MPLPVALGITRESATLPTPQPELRWIVTLSHVQLSHTGPMRITYVGWGTQILPSLWSLDRATSQVTLILAPFLNVMRDSILVRINWIITYSEKFSIVFPQYFLLIFFLQMRSCETVPFTLNRAVIYIDVAMRLEVVYDFLADQ
jgi:hypothetical protein